MALDRPSSRPPGSACGIGRGGRMIRIFITAAAFEGDRRPILTTGLDASYIAWYKVDIDRRALNAGGKPE
jgi:hypothetical protein